MGCLFVVTALSQVKLQTWERSGTVKLAKDSKRFDFTFRDRAKRGSILSADLKPLAEDEQSTELTVQFDKVPHSDAFFMELAKATDIPGSEFSALATSGAKSKTWLEPVSQDRYREVMAIRKAWRADGLSLTATGQRTYPLADASSCLVGVIRDYKEGPVHTGLERSMNTQLSGINGFQVGLTDSKGEFLPMRMEKQSTPRQDGRDVVLTIDSDMQLLAAQAIKAAVIENKADDGVALVMDPKTGNILAMANWPSFDPNVTTGGQGVFGFNPAYMAQLEPGSMFKTLTLAKGLDSGAVKLSDEVDCAGEWHPTPRTTIHCDSHHGNRAHGTVDPLDAIARSCNVSAGIWATKIGRDPFLEYIKDLGLLNRTNLHVPYERNGNVNYNEPNHPLQLATMGFGQSITCTPTALIGAFGMIGNGGVLMEPRLVERVGTKTMPPSKPRTIVSADSANKVLTCMEAVIQSSEGTGAKLRIPGYRMAGKTGTAQKVGKGEKGYVSNFVGFVPAQNPRAVILVMVDHPKGVLYYGADVAGPVFKQVAKAVIRHFNLQPTEPINAKPLRRMGLPDRISSVGPVDKGIQAL